MLKTLAQLGKRNNRNKLSGGHANELRHDDDQHVAQGVVQQVVAVVAPHRHLALGVVQRMQTPPPLKMMLPPVHPIVQKIKNDQVNEKTDEGQIRHTWPQGIELQGTQPCYSQRAKHVVQQGLQAKKQRNAKKP